MREPVEDALGDLHRQRPEGVEARTPEQVRGDRAQAERSAHLCVTSKKKKKNKTDALNLSILVNTLHQLEV